MDPQTLHARGRLALLEWNPDVALEALQAARDLGASQPGVTIDLATAYFQRGEIRGANGSADFTLALDLLGRVIQQDSKNTAARFNRAIVAERLHLLAPAVADLEEVVRSEESGDWRKEAEERLARLRQALQGFFDRPPTADRERFAEVALDQELSAGLTHQAAQTADRFLREHGDYWLAEVIPQRNSRYRDLIRQLSTLASIRGTSARGRYSTEPELLRGWETAALPPPLRAWRDYESTYRATHSGGQFPCSPAVPSEEYRRHSYHWIAANLEREVAICASLAGSMASALAHSRQAVTFAREAKLPVTSIRNEAIDAAFDYRQGRYRETLTRFTALLGRIISERLPVVRSHEPLHNIVVSTSALGRQHAAHLVATMATLVADATGLQSAQFADRINGADAAFRAGNTIAAAELYRDALRVNDRAPSLIASPDARPWSEMILADLTGRSKLPEQLEGSKDPFVRLPYARLRAKQEESLGNVDGALRRLNDSMRWLVESSGPRYHQVWRQELRATADDLLSMIIRQRTPRESLATLQQLFDADEASLRAGSLRHSGWRPDIVFSLRTVGSDVYVWRKEGTSVELRQLPALLSRIEISTRRLRILVSSPTGAPAAIQAEAQSLTSALFGSWLSEIDPKEKILFQCEGILAEIPYPLLTTPQGKMGLNHEWALTRSAISDRPGIVDQLPAAATDRLFVDASHVGSLTAWNLQPLPYTREEQSALRRLSGRRFTELQGIEASAARLREALGSSSLLHFAGHAVAWNGTIGLLLEDGFLDLEGVLAPPTVVLSACSTGRAHQEEVDTLSSGTLAHRFVLDGAAEVLASSWNLDSGAAAEFASVLYSRLGASEDFGMASLAAARHLAGVASFAHPYYWAGQMRLIRT